MERMYQLLMPRLISTFECLVYKRKKKKITVVSSSIQSGNDIYSINAISGMEQSSCTYILKF